MELSNVINLEVNKKVLAMKQWFGQNIFAGLIDTVVAYSSLTIIYNPYLIYKKYGAPESVSFWVQRKLEQAYHETTSTDPLTSTPIRIPVCYGGEYGPDLELVSRETHLAVARIVELHLSKVYRVYMMGFLPGFAYLGELDPLLFMPRKDHPAPVKAGSVAIVANQTGMYPLDSPGGWYIIGRTPERLFEATLVNPVKFKAGDSVQFYKIAGEDFARWSDAEMLRN